MALLKSLWKMISVTHLDPTYTGMTSKSIPLTPTSGRPKDMFGTMSKSPFDAIVFRKEDKFLEKTSYPCSECIMCMTNQIGFKLVCRTHCKATVEVRPCEAVKVVANPPTDNAPCMLPEKQESSSSLWTVDTYLKTLLGFSSFIFDKTVRQFLLGH